MNTKKTGPEVSRIAFDSNSSSSSPSHVCSQRLLWDEKRDSGWMVGYREVICNHVREVIEANRCGTSTINALPFLPVPVDLRSGDLFRFHPSCSPRLSHL
jgi:hypothetical protein